MIMHNLFVMKKIPILTFVASLLLACQLFAGGVSGQVVDGKGVGKSSVRVTIKYGNQTNYTHTDRYGYYRIEVPKAYAGVRGKVYAQGIYISLCTIPKKGYNTVNVTIK